ncbi:hypothetical protein jpw_10245 [Pseudomonas asiatica]|uniref:hypothetical protein n=1 Tax=Pseudomonas asiatica TaxID=2219225 RepID=UPI0021F6DEBC|nr:hypothetical protein [Pseudomonas asiatica]UYP84522.1 hypothetical protein jpw_10245 [Pseudomonas asiatica]
MLPSPRIVAIDDKIDELTALTDALSRTGVACLSVHFNAEEGIEATCPDARVIFFDLHLLGDAVGTPEKHFSTIVTCLEQMGPRGPYAIILWSQHPDEADGADQGEGLHKYICERLDSAVPRPYGVMPLPKIDHLTKVDGKSVVSNAGLLRSKVDSLLSAHPQATALLAWEKYVLSAAAGTVAQLMDLSDGKAEQIKGVMASLAVAAVGPKNVDQDRFYALNEVLLPILSDRLSFFATDTQEASIWEKVFSASDSEAISSDKRGQINKFINLSTSVERISSLDRGAVVAYADTPVGDVGGAIERFFGMTLSDVACRCFALKDPGSLADAKWVLLQGQAACDYAQRKPQTLSYFLGLDVPFSTLKEKNRPDALWVSPIFSISGQDRVLLFNAGAMLVFERDYIKDVSPLYRLREQILNDLLFKLRNHQSRPGIIYL